MLRRELFQRRRTGPLTVPMETISRNPTASRLLKPCTPSCGSPTRRGLRRSSECPIDGHDVEFNPFRAAKQRHRRTNSNSILGKNAMKTVDVWDRMAVKGDQNVSIANAGGHRRAARLDRNDEDTAADAKTVTAYQPPVQRYILPCNANVAASNFAVLY